MLIPNGLNLKIFTGWDLRGLSNPSWADPLLQRANPAIPRFRPLGAGRLLLVLASISILPSWSGSLRQLIFASIFNDLLGLMGGVVEEGTW